MFCKLDVRSKSIVTLTLSWYNRKIVVRYFANRAPASHAMQAASIIALELQHSSKTQTSAETQDDFQHCWSLEQHADSTKWFTRYDFLLVFYSDLQSLNNCTCCLYMLKNTHPKTQKNITQNQDAKASYSRQMSKLIGQMTSGLLPFRNSCSALRILLNNYTNTKQLNIIHTHLLSK